MRPTFLRAAALLAPLLLASCASSGESSDYDPLEGVNRKIFAFNEKADQYVLAPIALGYDAVVPHGMQLAISRFFTNLGYPASLVSNLAQGKPGGAWDETQRFAVNTTVGLAGFFDPAAKWGIEPSREDFGQTLGSWGVDPGVYIVIPILGPSNARDFGGRFVDTAFSLPPYFLNGYELVAFQVESTINSRALSLEQVDELRRVSFDFYVLVRDAYYQRRMALVADGDPTAPVENPDADDDLYFDDDEDDLYFFDDEELEGDGEEPEGDDAPRG